MLLLRSAAFFVFQQDIPVVHVKNRVKGGRWYILHVSNPVTPAIPSNETLST